MLSSLQKKFHRILIPDMIGFGFSDKPVCILRIIIQTPALFLFVIVVLPIVTCTTKFTLENYELALLSFADVLQL